MSKHCKIVVFDLDETLGNFVELGMFCDALEYCLGSQITQQHFFEIIDIFPELLRPNIIEIIKYLLKKKKSLACNKIMIYTNNNGPKSWTENISKYFEFKIGENIFDDIIAAFKANGRRVEICRTTHNKTVRDIIRCTKVPKDTQICFLDDQYHQYMKHKNVYYINIKPYVYSFEFPTMAERYYDKFNSSIDTNISKGKFINDIDTFMRDYNYTVVTKTHEDLGIDKIISKKIMVHLKTFFRDFSKTRKARNKYMRRKTSRK